jgi:phosphatidylserine/phosphatidylglycerophosphate/cardiolipin synthase-like enzyme
MVAEARHSIIIESPYFVVSSHLDKAFDQALARGVKIVILTNSLATTDQTLVYGGYANQKRRLLRQGVELWEYAGPDHLHAKSAIIDDRLSIIGSYNFDHRSEHLNTETAILSCDPCVAVCLAAAMAVHFANSWHIGPDGTPVDSPIKHPGADAEQLRKLRWSRLVAPVVRRHL